MKTNSYSKPNIGIGVSPAIITDVIDIDTSKPKPITCYIADIARNPTSKMGGKYNDAFIREFQEHYNTLNTLLIGSVYDYVAEQFNQIRGEVLKKKAELFIKGVYGPGIVYYPNYHQKVFIEYKRGNSSKSNPGGLVAVLKKIKLLDFMCSEAEKIITVKAGINQGIPDNVYNRISENTVEISQKEAASLYNTILHKKNEKRTLEEKIICHNLRLVINVAKTMAKKHMSGQSFREHLMEYISLGNGGLIIAAKRFDYNMNTSFFTYARECIMWAINSGIKKETISGVPKRWRNLKNMIYNAELCISRENERKPTSEEILTYVNQHTTYCSYNKYTVGEMQWAMQHLMGRYSITDLSMEDEERIIPMNTTLYSHNLPERSANLSMLKEKLSELFKDLAKQEQNVLKLRFGLDGKEPSTLEEIGIIYGVTRERIRQIVQRAINKLKYEERSKQLEPFLELLRE